MHFLDIDSPVMQFLGKMADLMILNLLTLFCCLPIITAGAALTALNYMSLKIARNEETYIVKGYFKAFKENFRQSTAIWLLFGLVAAVLVADYYIVLNMEMEINGIVKVCVLAVSILLILTFTFVFPVQAKFVNPVMRTIRNAFVISVLQFPKTILMIVMYLIPPVLILLSPNLVPIIIMFGMSVPALLSAKLYNKFFKGLEDRVRAESGETPPADEDEHIFSDEVIIDSDTGENH